MDNSSDSRNKAQAAGHDQSNNARTREEEGACKRAGLNTGPLECNSSSSPILSGPFDRRGSTEVETEACARIKHPQETALR